MATLQPTSAPAPVLTKITPDNSSSELQSSNVIEQESIILSDPRQSQPKPILQQEKSGINTNPFIPDNQKQAELYVVQSEANDIILKQYNENISSSIQNLSLSDINRNISNSCIGLLDDSFNKPDNITWIDYIQIIIKKDQRYTYIGFLFIFIAFYILLVSD
jgi:hypothetical protein